MFKQITAAILLLAILVQTFNKAVIVTSYYANTGAYAKNCINKAKPKLHCNGKCQMMKKLNQEENKNESNTSGKVAQDDVISSKSFFITVLPIFNLHETLFALVNLNLPIGAPSNFFHPPGA